MSGASQQIYIPLRGGVDQATPPLEAAPGSLRDSSNFDVNTVGGYRRIDGYEKWDGTPLANSHGYWSMLVAATGAINAGRTIVGVTSGASAYVLGFDASSFVHFVQLTGTFEVGETVNISGAPVGTVSDAAMLRVDRQSAESSAWMALSASQYRASVQTVPGSGPLRGLQFYLGDLYAWRNAVDGLTLKLHKSSASGWQEVGLGQQVAFTAGAVALVDGATLTKGAVTATILRVVIESGSVGAGTAAGRLIIGTPSGGNFSAGAATATGGGTLTLAGVQSAITHAPGGRVRSVLSNFGPGERMYWASGVDYAFEYDGAVAVPIRTGMLDDKPTFLHVHKNHLFLTFNNSLQHSAIGNPYAWSPILGAGELNMGETISNLLPQPSDAQSGGAMVVSTRNSMFVLYGTSSADWKLVTYQRDAGSLPHTMASIAANTYYLDDRGITNLSQTQTFGNFESNSISEGVRNWLTANKVNINDTCVVKEKNQYRLFFAGGTAMHVTFNGAQVSGLMPIQYGHNIILAHSTELPDGTERVFYGDDAGSVFVADNGPSFAGENIQAFFKLQFNHCKSPRMRKRFRKVTFEVGGGGYAGFDVGYELSYAGPDSGTQQLLPINAEFAGTRWDDPGVFWDSGVWDGRVLLPVEVSLDGTGENIGITVFQSSALYMGLNFQAALLQFTPRRANR